MPEKREKTAPELIIEIISFGKTQLSLADELGVTKMTIWRWKRDSSVPHKNYMKQLLIIHERMKQKWLKKSK